MNQTPSRLGVALVIGWMFAALASFAVMLDANKTSESASAMPVRARIKQAVTPTAPVAEAPGHVESPPPQR